MRRSRQLRTPSAASSAPAERETASRSPARPAAAQSLGRPTPSQPRVLARAASDQPSPAGSGGGTGAGGGSGGGGSGGGGSGGGGGGGDSGGDSDGAYRDVLQHIREEQEQLGQLIQHPF